MKGKGIQADGAQRARATASLAESAPPIHGTALVAAGAAPSWLAGCVFILLPVLLWGAPATALTPPQPASSTKQEAISPIQRQAESYILSQVPEFIQVESIAWTGVRIPTDVGEDVQIRISPAARFTWFGPQRLLAEYPSTSGRVRKLWLSFEVRGQARVACAVEGLARGKVLSDANTRIVAVPLAELPPDYVTDVSALVGRKALRQFREGEILSSRSFEQIADIRRGEKVGVILSQSRFTVETVGVAQEDGRVGEVIFVKNPESGKTFLGRILSDHRVEVTL
ncbi:MAG: flagellar basal body P-ring formation protein FlgA [Nitrospirae bacterium]|nr:flagellar basal body P-ring formation protein FlgA [Nitrospirota bacterium]